MFSLAVLTAGVLFGACEGKEGPQGPAGAKGDTGATGPAGAIGATGTANVIFSEWIPMPATAAASLPSRKNFSFSAPKITQEVLDKALVYGYVKYSPTGVVPLPYAGRYTTSNGEILGSFLNTILLGLGGISFNQDWLTPGTIPRDFADAKTVIGGFTHLRYVIVPGGVQARIAGLDYSDYEAVKKHYGLKD